MSNVIFQINIYECFATEHYIFKKLEKNILY